MNPGTLSPGDTVAVLDADVPGHIRTPFYVRGKRGVIERAVGPFRNPEELAYGRSGEPKRMLYRVRFAQAEGIQRLTCLVRVGLGLVPPHHLREAHRGVRAELQVEACSQSERRHATSDDRLPCRLQTPRSIDSI